MNQLPTLHDYQETAVDFMTRNTHCGLFLPMGFGKTLSTLSALSRIMPNGHILIIAPLNIVKSTWFDEIDKWGFSVRAKSLVLNDNGKKLTKAKRQAIYDEALDPSTPATLYFINQDLAKDLVDYMPVKTINKVRTRMWPFPTVIIDESQGFKSSASVRFKALKAVRPAISRLIELTGTPSPNGPLDLYGQIYLLDQGAALGSTMTAYKGRYFLPSKYVNGTAVAWEPRPGAEEEIYSRIKHLVMSVENTSLKMPPRLPINDVLVHMDPHQMDRYLEMKKTAVLDVVDIHGTEVEVSSESAGVLMNRLLQLASGGMYTDDQHNYTIAHEAKLMMLDHMLKNINGPILVPYRFVFTRIELMRRLKELGHDVHHFDGSREMVRGWNEQKYPVMLIQPASAGHGLNLQDGGHTLIWYSLPHSLEHYQQTNARLDRQGQKNSVAIHRLLTAGTRDMMMPGVLAGKAMTQADLLEAVRVEVQDTLSMKTRIRMDGDFDPGEVDERFIDSFDDSFDPRVQQL